MAIQVADEKRFVLESTWAEDAGNYIIDSPVPDHATAATTSPTQVSCSGLSSLLSRRSHSRRIKHRYAARKTLYQ